MDDAVEVVDRLGSLIASARKSLQVEYEHPSCNQDDSDDRIKRLRCKIAALTDMRQTFEHLVYGGDL